MLTYSRVMSTFAAFAAIVAIVVAGVAYEKLDGLVTSNRDLLEKQESEGRDRRDSFCRGQELAHLQEIKDLRRSYDYYSDPPPGLEALLRDRRSIEQLLERERAARSDTDGKGEFVPEYCDDPGFGLPEIRGKDGKLHDPTVPQRPAVVDRAVRMARHPAATNQGGKP